MSKRWVVAVLAMCMALVVLAGCGSSDDSSSSSSDTASTEASETTGAEAGGDSVLAEAEAESAKSEEIPTTIASADLPKFAPKSGFKIYYVNCEVAVEGCANQYKGFSDAAKVLGWSTEQCDAGFDPQQAIKCFENGVNADADAIVVNGFTETDTAPGYEAAVKAGIPVIGSFTGNKPDASTKAEMALTQGLTQGKEVANWVIADSGGTANVLFVGETSLGIDRQRHSSFEERIEECEECTNSYLQFSTASAETTLPPQLQAELNSNPDIEYIVGTYDGVALAAATAVRSAGKAESIKVVGLDANIPNLELIKKGEIQVADAANGSREPAWTTADATARVLSGVDVPHDVPTATMVITANNIGDLPGGEFQGAIDFEKQFEELWEK